MHDVASVANARFEYAVGRRIGDHHGGKLRRVALGLGLQVREIDVTPGVAAHHHHGHAGHVRRRRIGAVGRRRDETDGTVGFAAARVIGPDRQ